MGARITEDGELLYVVADAPGGQSGDLYVYQNGEPVLLDTDVQLRNAPTAFCRAFVSSLDL